MDAIINKYAGGRRASERTRRSDDLLRLFKMCGLEVQVHWVAPQEVPALVDRLVQAGARELLVGGGDGTLSAAAHRLAGTDTALGVLPLGTLNHFARDLGMPVELEDAIAVLAKGRRITVDVGTVNGRVFINNASLGAYVHVAHRRNAYQSRLGMRKWPAMGLAMLRVFWRMPALALTLTDEEGAEAIRAPFVFVGNNAYLREGSAGIERQSLGEGKLSVVFSRQLGRLGVVRMGVKILLGRFDDTCVLEQHLTSKVRIAMSGQFTRVALDGELIKFATPLEICIRPCALKVIAP